MNGKLHEIKPELRLPPPRRRVRYTGRTRFVRRLVWNLAWAVMAALCFFSSRDLGELRGLANHGRSAQALVTGKDVKRDKHVTYFLLYDFTVEKTTVDGSQAVTRNRYETTPLGTVLPVTYLPGNPATYRLGTVDAQTVGRSTQTWTLIWTFATVFVVFAVGIMEASLAGKKRLLEQGIPTEGTVIKQHNSPTKNTAYHFAYLYTLQSGAPFDAVTEVSRAVYEAYPDGSSITVLYDPNEPTRHVLYPQLSAVEIKA